jgi:hypothetical protein
MAGRKYQLRAPGKVVDDYELLGRCDEFTIVPHSVQELVFNNGSKLSLCGGTRLIASTPFHRNWFYDEYMRDHLDSKLKITTRSGSVYILNQTEMTFSRFNTSEEANVRIGSPEISGKLLYWPFEFQIGRGLFLGVSYDKPNVGLRETYLSSTPVVSIESVD